MLRQLVYWVRIPERRRAMSIPSSRPETTMERAVARRCGGARSPTSGSMSWGVTVVTAVMKESARKTENDFVTHRPTHLNPVSNEVTLRESPGQNLRYATYNCGSEKHQCKYKMSSPKYVS